MALDQQPGAWALIFCPSAQSFLLGRRSSSVKKPGVWNLFGGRIDSAESVTDALLREIWEETGFAACSNGSVEYGGARCAIPLPLGFVDGLRQLHYFLLVLDHEAIPTLNAEHAEYRWFQAGELPSDLNRVTKIAINIGLIQKAMNTVLPGSASGTNIDFEQIDLPGTDCQH